MNQSIQVHVSELRMCETSAEWDYLTIPDFPLGGRRLTPPAVLAEVPSRWDGWLDTGAAASTAGFPRVG